jgi:hypothetical protein
MGEDSSSRGVEKGRWSLKSRVLVVKDSRDQVKKLLIILEN